MSSSTPNIGLTLPIGTEKVSRAIINQNMTKIDAAFGSMPYSTMRPVPFDVAVSDWSGSGTSWTATFATAYVTSTSQEILTYTSSIKAAKAEDLDATKQPGGGGIVFTSTKKPIDTISGTIYVWDTDDGKIPVIIEGTVTPIENGGTNASNLTGAKQNLGISALETNVQNLSDQIGKNTAGTEYNLTSAQYTTPSDGYVYCDARTTNTSGIAIYDSGTNSIGYIGYGTLGTCFVRKGMHVYATGAPTTAKFIPLT